jgi:hypothetical protein
LIQPTEAGYPQQKQDFQIFQLALQPSVLLYLGLAALNTDCPA